MNGASVFVLLHKWTFLVHYRSTCLSLILVLVFVLILVLVFVLHRYRYFWNRYRYFSIENDMTRNDNVASRNDNVVTRNDNVTKTLRDRIYKFALAFFPARPALQSSRRALPDLPPLHKEGFASPV